MLLEPADGARRPNMAALFAALSTRYRVCDYTAATWGAVPLPRSPVGGVRPAILLREAERFHSMLGRPVQKGPGHEACLEIAMKHWSPDHTSTSTILALIAEYSSDVIAQVRSDMTFSYISPSSERLFRRRTSEVVGHHIAEFVVPEDLPLIAEATRRVTSGAADDAVVTVRVIRGDGTLMWVEVASRLMGGSTPGASSDRAVIMRDVSDRKALEDDLRAMAMKDGLTGLANRRAFDEVLLTEWKRTIRGKSQMSLLMADIDDFKKFNDAYGHQVGDDCLRSVGLALQSAAQRPNDVVARYGGEEIAIILPDSDAGDAEIVSERARKAVEDLRITHAGGAGRAVTVSIGAATALARDGGSAEMPQALLSAADRALYIAKAAGRNCCRSTLLLVTA